MRKCSELLCTRGLLSTAPPSWVTSRRSTVVDLGAGNATSSLHPGEDFHPSQTLSVKSICKFILSHASMACTRIKMLQGGQDSAVWNHGSKHRGVWTVDDSGKHTFWSKMDVQALHMLRGEPSSTLSPLPWLFVSHLFVNRQEGCTPYLHLLFLIAIPGTCSSTGLGYGPSGKL